MDLARNIEAKRTQPHPEAERIDYRSGIDAQSEKKNILRVEHTGS